MLNEREIVMQCKKNNFKYNYFGDIAIITTNVDQWYLRSVVTYDKNKKDYIEGILLKHKNTRGNRSGKAHYHKQRFAKNLKHAFDTIISHEENGRSFNKAFKMKKMLETNIK